MKEYSPFLDRLTKEPVTQVYRQQCSQCEYSVTLTGEIDLSVMVQRLMDVHIEKMHDQKA